MRAACCCGRPARFSLSTIGRSPRSPARLRRAPATLRVGVPLELPGSVLPRALADMGAAFPQTRAEISHASSAAQLAALVAGRP